MPFLGVLPHRQALFQPQPQSDIGVSDAQAWRLNPQHRLIYNKLHIALAQGLKAAPCGVSPLDMGLAPDSPLFVKPITNLAGMSLDAAASTAAELALSADTSCAPGRFWCEFLQGEQSSTDCLVHRGEVVWFAHTQAATEKNRSRPIYWQIGVDLPAQEQRIAAFVAAQLPNYTGLCNLELIGDSIIEGHLRGSNAFFDFYGDDFMARWVELVDQDRWAGLAPISGGCLYSLFGEQDLPQAADQMAAEQGVRLVPDRQMVADRAALLYAPNLSQAQRVAELLGF